MSRPLRVLYVITDSGTGGAEKKLFDILSLMPKAAAAPCAVAILKGRREMAERWASTGVPVVSFGMGRIPGPFTYFKLARFIKDKHPDIVHSLTLHSVLMARAVHAFNRSFRLVSAPCLNYREMPGFIQFVLKKTRDWDDAVVCESTPTRDYLIKTMAHDGAKAVYLPNGIDTEAFVPHPEGRRRLRAEWGLKDNEILVGSVGRLHAQKGFDILLEAFDVLRKNSIPYRGVIVGTGPEEAALKALIAKKNLPVRLAGARTDMADVLSALDIYVQSSRYEGMSRALMEAMSAGCAIVATAVDGTLDLAQDGKNMLLCKPNEAESISLGVGTLIEKPHLRKELSHNARATAGEFTTKKMIARLQKLYEGTVS